MKHFNWVVQSKFSWDTIAFSAEQIEFRILFTYKNW